MRLRVVVSALLALSRSLVAQDSLAKVRDPHAAQPERPTLATHAGTVAPGWLEIETGVERDRVGGSPAGTLVPTLLKFGIADDVQLSVFGGWSRAPRSSGGLADAGVGVKWRLIDDAPIVGTFAVFPSIKLPTGSETRGTGTGTTDVSLLLISSYAAGGVAIDLNAGYTRRSGDGSRAPRDAAVWTASFGGSVAGPWGWVVETYGYPATSGPSGQPSLVALLAGPTFQLHESFIIDAGIIAPVMGPQPRALYAGVTYNVARLWGPRR